MKTLYDFRTFSFYKPQVEEDMDQPMNRQMISQRKRREGLVPSLRLLRWEPAVYLTTRGPRSLCKVEAMCGHCKIVEAICGHGKIVKKV